MHWSPFRLGFLKFIRTLSNMWADFLSCNGTSCSSHSSCSLPCLSENLTPSVPQPFCSRFWGHTAEAQIRRKGSPIPWAEDKSENGLTLLKVTPSIGVNLQAFWWFIWHMKMNCILSTIIFIRCGTQFSAAVSFFRHENIPNRNPFLFNSLGQEMVATFPASLVCFLKSLTHHHYPV